MSILSTLQSLWPVSADAKITSGFGGRVSPAEGASTNHLGVDISVPIGTSVVSTISGIVTAAGYDKSRGKYVEVSQGNVKTLYQHLSAALVEVGDQIAAGSKIALSGNTGVSTGPHLDYRVFINDKAVDPTSAELGSGPAFTMSLPGLAGKAMDVTNTYWGVIIGGLLVLGLLGGRKSA